MSDPPYSLKRFSCPACKALQAVITFERLGRTTFFCPDCQHVWEEANLKRPPTSG